MEILDAGHHGPNSFWSLRMSTPSVSDLSGGPADDQHGTVVIPFGHVAAASCSRNKLPIP
jgi:hypothetical protein